MMEFDENYLKAAIKRFFGFNEFLPGQPEIINSILFKRDTLVVMPTGAGKSLCYQLPAAILDGTAIVISPLIALMKDQVDSLKNTNLRSASINSSQSFSETSRTITQALRGVFKLIYIAPERLESRNFINELKNINISFIAIDEAHCISEWGHDFRPSYLNIANVIDSISNLPKIALTATATPEVQEDILTSLKMRNPNQFIRGFDRKNLSYQTIYTYKKDAHLNKILKKTKGPAIVYCGTRKRVNYFSAYLKENGHNAVAYHAGLNNDIRTKAQSRFMSGESQVIVATNAFGMGINKLNVRAVVHCDLTQSIESYYQEAGRAGRDGLPSDCILIYNKEDIQLQEFFIESNFPAKDVILLVYNALKSIFGATQNSDELESYNFDIKDFANQINLPFLKVNSVLNLFEINNLVKFNSNGSYQSVKLTMDSADLKEFFYSTDLKQKIVLEYLLRNIPASAYNDFRRVDISKISQLIGLSNEEFRHQLRYLELSGVLILKEAAESSNITLNIEAGQDIFKIIDFQKLQSRKINAYKKLDKVVQFAYTEECKRNFILEYFSDKNYEGVCGKCSSCMEISSDFNEKIFGKTINDKEVSYDLGGENIEVIGQDRQSQVKISTQSQKVYDLINLGKNLVAISNELKVNEAEIAWCIQELIENDYFVLMEQFIDYEKYQKVMEIVEKYPNKPLKTIREKFDDVISFPDLRIATAFARKELGLEIKSFRNKK